MLVAGLGAGVALADEPEAAQQTQSETMQQGSEGQQPATETGDVADETNTNADDQTDPSQGADGDEGADVEPGDGDSEESDQTQESDADKADGVAKKAASMPAPQSADSNAASVQPRSINKVLNEETRPSTSTKVKVYAFDYDESINNGHTLQFNDGAGNGINKYQNNVQQGIVNSQLDGNGYPKLSGPNGQSLDYLFNDKPVAGKTSYTNNGNGLDGLFTFDETTGYYEYDSAKNYATLVGNDGGVDDNVDKFRVYDQGRFQSGWDPTQPFGYAAFLPFNDLEKDDQNYFNDSYWTTTKNWYGQTVWDSETHGFGGADGYKIDNQNVWCQPESHWGQYHTVCSYSDDGYADYHFGMSVGAEFYMPEDRTVNGENMVFEFGGDDDVWVFLDGHLVMDLGGIHDYRTGSINFTDGTVTVQNDDADLDDLYGSNEWADDSTTHELKVFYLERGKGGSNCKFKFNLPAISSDQIQIAKTVVGDKNENGYKFNAYVSNDGQSDLVLYKGDYVVRTIGQPGGGTPHTADDGVITLKANEYATLTDPTITVNAKYYVVEQDASEYTVTASGGSGQKITVTPDAAEGTATTDPVTVRDVPYMTVKNTKPTQPGIQKQISKVDGDNDHYNLELSVTGKTVTDTDQSSVKAPVDVVFVLDKSTSMDDRISGYDSETKLNAMKNAAKQLANTILGNENLDARIGIIKFSGSAENVPINGQKWSNNAAQVVQAIANIDTPWWGDGTDWTEALKQVSDEYSATRQGAVKYLVFLTDGDPVDDSGDRVTNYTTEGQKLVRNGWNIMNIGVGLSHNNKLDGLNRSEYNSVTDHEKQKVQLFQSDDQASLNDAFTSIGQIIESTETVISQGNIVITDTISQWAEAEAITADSNTGVVSGGVTVKSSNGKDLTNASTIFLSGKTLTVSLPASYTLAEGETVTVSFKVKPSASAYETYAANLAGNESASENDLYAHDGATDVGEEGTGDATSAGKPGFFSNDSATLSYKECSVTEGGEPSCVGDPKPMTYNKPVLQVKATSMTVTKVWNGGNSHSDVTVKLFNNGKDTGRTLTLNNGNDWTGTFNALIPGHTYTVAEVTIPGYTSEVSYTKGTKDAENLIVAVPDVWGNPANALKATITNTLSEVLYEQKDHLNLKKVLEGRELKNQEFSFTLTDATENTALAGGMKLPSVTTVSNNADGVFAFGDIKFTKAGTYKVEVREKTDKKEPGIAYDEHVLTVQYTIHEDSNGALVFNPITDRNVLDSNGNAVTDLEDLKNLLTWTNHYVAVSNLPLTGGNSTARTLLLTGGGVLLVAGAAWLLARRRRV